MATKYPLVLVHGIMLKDIRFFKAFGRIQRLLCDAGHRVTTAPTDGFGSLETNAAQLKAHIEQVLEQSGADKVNLIAHSKGGLDCRYMIEQMGLSDRVASLTSLCTPHRGSRVATRLYALPKPIKYPIAAYLHVAYRIFGDAHPEVLKVCRQLAYAPDGVPDLNRTALPDSIFVQSYSATMTRSRDDFVMGIPHFFSRVIEKEGETDGLVSRESAMFGRFQGDCTDTSLSHTEIVDLTLSKKKKAQIYAFYLKLCEDLAQRGY